MAGYDSRPVNAGYTVVDGTTTGNYNNGNPNVYVKTWMEYKVLQDATDIANVRSRVDVKLYSQVINGGSSSGMSNAFTANNYGYAGFDGSNRAYLSTTYDFNNYNLNKFADATLTIPHNADGTKTTTIEASFTTLSGTWAITGGSASKSITLPPIPRGTELVNISDQSYGFPSTFNLSRKASNLRENITMTNGGTTLTIKTTSTSDVNFSYTLNRSYTPNTTKPSSSTWTITIKTYNGGTLVETKTYSKVWSIRNDDEASYKPTVTGTTWQAYNDVISAFSTDTMVAGYSKMQVNASSSNITTKFGASVSSRVVTFSNGSSGTNANTYRSSIYATAGNATATYVVTDSRGFATSVSCGPISVVSSNAPTINVSECFRGNNDGTANPSGQYLWATATASCDSLNGHNSLSVRKVQASGFSAVNFTNGTRVQLASSASASSTYTVTFTATDLLRTTTVTRTIPAEDVLFNARKDGKGVGIGAYCEGEGLISVGYQFSGAIKSKGDRIFGTCNLIDMASLEQGQYGVNTSDARRVFSGLCRVQASTTYTCSFTTAKNTIVNYIIAYDSSGNQITWTSPTNQRPMAFTTPSGCAYVRVQFTNQSQNITPSDITNLMLEKGSSASSFVPFAMDNVELTERVSGKKVYFTPTNCTAYADFDSCWYMLLGNKVRIHIGATSPSSTGANITIATLPSGYRPKGRVYGCGASSDTVMGYCYYVINKDGAVAVCTQKANFGFECEFSIE